MEEQDGFAYGIEKAIKIGYHYAWVMDDDSIPEAQALESLANKAEDINYEFSFMASLVYWTDGKLFPMNVPHIDYKKRMNTIDIISKYKIAPINSCSFVGCFININYAKQSALPISEFFIYGDDVEYTNRLKKLSPAYIDLDSIIVHKAPSNNGADIATADQSRIKRFYLQSRNGMYIARKEHKIFRRFLIIGKRFLKIIAKAPDHRIKRIWMLIKGTFAGFFFNPKLKYVETSENEEP